MVRIDQRNAGLLKWLKPGAPNRQVSEDKCEDDRDRDEPERLDRMFCIVGRKDKPNQVQQDSLSGAVSARSRTQRSCQPSSHNDRETYEDNDDLRCIQSQRPIRKLRVQHDYRTKVNKLCCDECLDEHCGLGIPRQPFAESRGSEARQKEADCQPGGDTSTGTGALGVHAVDRETKHDDKDVGRRCRCE